MKSYFSILLFLTSLFCNGQLQLSVFNDFKYYNKENGLASAYISAIREDKNGFLWLATGSGISGYDGNHFTNFTSFYENDKESEIGYVNSLIIDDSGEKIYFGGRNGVFYTQIDTLEKINRLNNFSRISDIRLNYLLLDSHKKLWVASFSDGLHCLDLKGSKDAKYLFKGDSGIGSTKLNSLQCISIDPKNPEILWIGTLAGLVRFNTVSEEYKIYVFNNEPEMAQNQIRKILATEDKVFLGTWTKGLVIFDKNSNQFNQPLKGLYPDSYSLILEIYNDENANLLITTGDGLIQYDLQTQSVKRIIDHNEDKGLIRGISYTDSRGIVWYGHGKGLFKYDPLQSLNPFIKLEDRNSIQYPLMVREILKSGNFVYVAGLYSSGLYKINLKDRSVTVIRNLPFYYHKKKGYIISDIVKMSNGNFLIISNKKLAIFNPKTLQVELSPLQVDHPNPALQSIVKDKNDNYWVGGREGGLFFLDFKNNIVKNYKKEFNVFRDENHRWINNLYIDSGNRLWVGKGSSSYIDLNDLSFVLPDPKKGENIKTYTDVGEFYEDNAGRIWMTGGSNGLGFTTINNFDKGISQKVDGHFSGVYAFNDSLLWTTGRNLGTYNMKTDSYREIKFSSNNKNLRVYGPVIPVGKGEYIAGCDNGVLVYHPDKDPVNTEIPLPYIRKIVSNGKTLYEGNSLSKKDFSFNSGTRHLILKISSLGFHFSDQITYQYKFDGDWQNIGSGKEINLTNLSHGNYNLKIRACNNPGKCNNVPVEYSIFIPTPWWFSWWAYLLYVGLAILFADRFYRFQLSKRLAIAESAKLKEINQLKSSFYTNITHEFRTPLTVILGMANSLESSIKENQQAESEHSLEMIRRNGNNLLSLVNEMLDLSKLENGSMSLQPVQSDVVLFVKYLSESFYSLANEKQIDFMVYTEVEEMVMDFDPNKLSAVISNLLSNAIKYTESGGKIIVHLNQVIKDNKKFFLLKVKDNGPGVSEKEMEHIFDRFYQADNIISQKLKGTGIGLALTKEFTELMGGTILVKSNPGKGSEFIIRLPVTNEALQTDDVQISPEPKLLESTKEEISVQPTSTDSNGLPLVLIIEDNEDVVHYLTTCLKGKYQTIHAPNGEIGINSAFESIPDIVICDVMMPVKDGHEVCSILKSDERTDHIPIIMLTAKVTLKDRLTGLSYGADAYLTKPFVKAELLTRLDQLVTLRRKMMQKINQDNMSHFLKIRAENPETKFLQKIIKIIQEEINNPSFGTTLHLAHKMHLSESQIYRKLKAITGKSTAVFIRSIRLQNARELILKTDKTITEIAYEVGFNDPSWFGRAFKEEFGFAPGAMSK